MDMRRVTVYQAFPVWCPILSSVCHVQNSKTGQWKGRWARSFRALEAMKIVQFLF